MTTQAVRAFHARVHSEHVRSGRPALRAFERLMVRRAHPRRIMIDMAALPWAVYFLWHQDWMRAVLVTFIFGALGLASVWRTDPEKLAETTLGRIALLHLHPMNLALQTFSLIPLLYGIWVHETELILLGTALLFAGHTFGWGNVDSRFTYLD